MEMLYFAESNRAVMRKLAVLCVLSLFLFNTGGYFIWFRISQQVNYSQVRREIRAGLDDHDLDILRIPADMIHNIIWIKPGKEFFYKGELYDVVKSGTEDKAVVFHCLKDTKEKELIARFSRKTHEEQQRNKMFKKMPLLCFIFQPNNAGSYFASCTDLFPFCQFLYQPPETESHSPPPNSFLS
jgi:hypothetical protein